MGKYLHRYEAFDEFQKDYNDDEGGINSFVCSAGTFTYDRAIDNGSFIEYVWKNGEQVLETYTRTPLVGNECGEPSGAYSPSDSNCIEITAVGEFEPGKYIEPWVSYTTYESQIEIEATTLYEKSGDTPHFVGSNVVITPLGPGKIWSDSCR